MSKSANISKIIIEDNKLQDQKEPQNVKKKKLLPIWY